MNGSDWMEITPLIASNWNPRPPKAYKEEGGRCYANVGGFRFRSCPLLWPWTTKSTPRPGLRLLLGNMRDVVPTEKSIRTFYGPRVHEQWLERQRGSDDEVPDWVQDAGLDLHYDDLDDEEQCSYDMTVRVCMDTLEKKLELCSSEGLNGDDDDGDDDNDNDNDNGRAGGTIIISRDSIS